MPKDQYRQTVQPRPANINAAFAVTPDDAASFERVIETINVAQTGSVRVTMVSGDEVTFFVAAGIQFPCRCTRIHATGTTATGIVAGY